MNARNVLEFVTISLAKTLNANCFFSAEKTRPSYNFIKYISKRDWNLVLNYTLFKFNRQKLFEKKNYTQSWSLNKNSFIYIKSKNIQLNIISRSSRFSLKEMKGNVESAITLKKKKFSRTLRRQNLVRKSINKCNARNLLLSLHLTFSFFLAPHLPRVN